jgi:hypothetical protein
MKALDPVSEQQSDTKPQFLPRSEPVGEIHLTGTVGADGNWVELDQTPALLVFCDENIVRLVAREDAGEYKGWKTPQHQAVPPEDQR